MPPPRGCYLRTLPGAGSSCGAPCLGGGRARAGLERGAPFVIVGRVGIDAAPQQQLHRLAVAIACQLAKLARRLGLAVHQLAAVLANHLCHLLVA
eukprot:7340878-Prymnesium_polylepis.1